MWWEKERKTEPHATETKRPADSLGVKKALSPPEEPRPKLPAILDYSNQGLENTMTEATLKTSALIPTNHRQTMLGSSVVLKGELSGDEDLTIEGQFDGTINLKDNCLTIGQNGQVKADINARQVIISGKLSGKVNARDKVEIHKTGNVVGDLTTMGVAIEEGAYFKGSIEILREEENTQSRAAVSSWTA
jgi:cytoskeletal protein CcmA (bactofilin family)